VNPRSRISWPETTRTRTKSDHPATVTSATDSRTALHVFIDEAAATGDMTAGVGIDAPPRALDYGPRRVVPGPSAIRGAGGAPSGWGARSLTPIAFSTCACGSQDFGRVSGMFVLKLLLMFGSVNHHDPYG
jgi:hypothetical protein